MTAKSSAHPTKPSPDTLKPGHFLLALMGAALGVGAALWILPEWLPDLVASLSGSSPKAYWYLARGSGFVAFVLLWLAVALGLGITNKLARLWPGGPAAVDVHQFVSLLALAFAAFHGLILLGDRYMNFTLADLVVPFSTEAYRPLWVGLGQIGFYLAVPVALSFYVRRWIGYRLWRALHYVSFAVYWLIVLHGVKAGTDTASSFGFGLYGITALSVYYLSVYRFLVAIRSAVVNRRRGNSPTTA